MIFADMQPMDWSSVLLTYGPLGVIAAIMLYFVMTYAPRLIESHLAFMNLCRETHAQQQDYNRRITESLETLTETASSQRAEAKKTQRMISMIAEAGKAAVANAEVHRHLDRVIDERDR